MLIWYYPFQSVNSVIHKISSVRPAACFWAAGKAFLSPGLASVLFWCLEVAHVSWVETFYPFPSEAQLSTIFLVKHNFHPFPGEAQLSTLSQVKENILPKSL